MMEEDIEEKLETETIDVGSKGLNGVIEEHKELIGKIVIIGSILVLTGVICILLKLASNQTAVILGIVLLIIVLLWRLPKPTPPPEKRGRVGEGWLITWADKFGHYTHAPKESTLVLTYGMYIVNEDGSIESIPDTLYYIFYKTNEIPLFINPLVEEDLYLLQKYMEKYGDVVWADGTDRYMTVFERQLKTMGVSI